MISIFLEVHFDVQRYGYRLPGVHCGSETVLLDGFDCICIEVGAKRAFDLYITRRSRGIDDQSQEAGTVEFIFSTSG